MEAALEPFRAEPARAAILTDVDGTLAPIVERPEQATLDPRTIVLIKRLADRYGLVGCISGRRAEEAKRLVRIDGIGYAGNHGLEMLVPGCDGPRPDPAVLGHERDAAEFVAGLENAALATSGLRLEDKGPIQALHWRGADDEALAEAKARDIATVAAAAGLKAHWGRKVLELRPKVDVGKDIAVAALLATAGVGSSEPGSAGDVDVAIYAGDDRTDLDAFRRLRELRDSGALKTAICVGVSSPEAPSELAEESDLTVDGPAGWLDVLEILAS
jgi:trehalose 6-phosphate phosphatase